MLPRHLVGDDVWQLDRLIRSSAGLRKRHEVAGTVQCFVAEVSGSSFGLGFETGYLLGATTKKVVLLYKRDVEKRISLLITGNTNPECVVVPYTDTAEVEAFVRNNF